MQVAQDLARRAGKLIMEIYATDFAVEFKANDPTNPVTLADREANRLIVDGLRGAFPDDSVLAEESADDASRLGRSRLWCVDPIDGTKEFVSRNDQFVVMIGLAIDGAAKLGVLYQPTRQQLICGAEGQCFLEDPLGSKALRVSQQANANAATAVVSRSHRSRTVEKVAQHMRIQRTVPIGSVGLKVAELARGSADIYISASDKTHEWDACGPEAVLVAAGGRVSDCLGQPLVYNKESTQTPYGILGTNGLLHQACVDAIAPLARERGWRSTSPKKI